MNCFVEFALSQIYIKIRTLINSMVGRKILSCRACHELYVQY